jgi:hypothetical protein
MISIVASVEVIIFGKPLLIRFSELGTIGPPYSTMSAEKSELALNVRNFRGSNSSNPCH